MRGKIKGRKRHIASDVLGLLLVVLVTAASVHDTAGGRAVVEQPERRTYDRAGMSALPARRSASGCGTVR
jgi:hypothetical protein